MAQTQTDAAPDSALAHYPVTFFAVVMGLAGLTLALRGASTALGLSDLPAQVMFYVTCAAFIAIAACYALKALRYPAMVRAEWNHPVRLAFFPASSISLLLISVAAIEQSRSFAEAVWLVGVAAQAVLTIAVVTGWIGTRSFQTGALSPAWFIPAVGNVIVPIAGAPLGYVELSWYFMAVGLIFYVVLLTLVINRLIFHDPLPGKLQPTLVILIAPPAVAFVAWLRLTGEIDAFARLLLNIAYFFTLIVAVQLPRIVKLPFAMSFWALSFPIAGISIASFVFAGGTGSAAHLFFGLVLLGALCVVIAALVLRTLRAMRAGEVCVPE